MFKRITRFSFRLGIFLALLSAALIFLPRLVTAVHAHSRVTSAAQSTATPTAIVFGAGLRRDGSPTPVLRERVITAANLYLDGKVQSLLMSGQSPEPAAMQALAISLGVPSQHIQLDNGGLRTYDTCYRARAIFGLDEAILVTQNFHLPRAIYTCNALQINARGVPADLYRYRRHTLLFWNIRETLATLVALWDVHITNPIPESNPS
ncbi:MAG: YdcF family protein [Anaerolineae bacterium]|nr:YdcF family protein [Anaerolineae bacterium]